MNGQEEYYFFCDTNGEYTRSSAQAELQSVKIKLDSNTSAKICQGSIGGGGGGGGGANWAFEEYPLQGLERHNAVLRIPRPSGQPNILEQGCQFLFAEEPWKAFKYRNNLCAFAQFSSKHYQNADDKDGKNFTWYIPVIDESIAIDGHDYTFEGPPGQKDAKTVYDKTSLRNYEEYPAIVLRSEPGTKVQKALEGRAEKANHLFTIKGKVLTGAKSHAGEEGNCPKEGQSGQHSEGQGQAHYEPSHGQEEEGQQNPGSAGAGGGGDDGHNGKDDKNHGDEGKNRKKRKSRKGQTQSSTGEGGSSSESSSDKCCKKEKSASCSTTGPTVASQEQKDSAMTVAAPQRSNSSTFGAAYALKDMLNRNLAQYWGLASQPWFEAGTNKAAASDGRAAAVSSRARSSNAHESIALGNFSDLAAWARALSQGVQSGFQALFQIEAPNANPTAGGGESTGIEGRVADQPPPGSTFLDRKGNHNFYFASKSSDTSSGGRPAVAMSPQNVEPHPSATSSAVRHGVSQPYNRTRRRNAMTLQDAPQLYSTVRDGTLNLAMSNPSKQSSSRQGLDKENEDSNDCAIASSSEEEGDGDGAKKGSDSDDKAADQDKAQCDEDNKAEERGETYGSGSSDSNPPPPAGTSLVMPQSYDEAMAFGGQMRTQLQQHSRAGMEAWCVLAATTTRWRLTQRCCMGCWSSSGIRGTLRLHSSLSGHERRRRVMMPKKRTVGTKFTKTVKGVIAVAKVEVKMKAGLVWTI